MPKAIPSPTASSFKHKFDELPVFFEFTGGTVWRTGRIDGEFEVSYETDGDWIVTDVWIATDNGRYGSDALGRTVHLDADRHEAFYLLALDAIEAQYKSLIEEMIAEELAERRVARAA
jgi:hypothetical protein